VLDLLLGVALSVIGGGLASHEGDDATVCLLARGLPLCTGVVIAPHTVLTAGHCVNPVGPDEPYFIGIGPDCTKPRQQLRVERMVAHPAYTREGGRFDLGVVKLRDAAPLTPLTIRWRPLDRTVVGRSLRHVGYGTTEEGVDLDGQRREVTHPILMIDHDFVWSGDEASNTCVGDSGGPALLDGQVVAVISDGPGCHAPSADQRVDLAAGWLRSMLAQWEPKPRARK
jgi:V8-like Glu-specific endopeptidase